MTRQVSLESARVNAKMTISDVAEKIDKSEKTISNWESGKTAISATMFFGLCELYGIDPDIVKVPVVSDGKFDGKC